MISPGRILSDDGVNDLLCDIFSHFGDIDSVTVSRFKSDNQPNRVARINSRFAHLLFKKRSSLKSALKADGKVYEPILQNCSQKWGIKDYLSPRSLKDIADPYLLFNVDVSELKSHVDGYMRTFDEGEQLEIQEINKKRKIKDDDGFIQVQSRKKLKRRMLATRGSSTNGLTAKEERKKKKKYELTNFYRFQMKEEKKAKLLDLRKRFEEDKAKVATMKLNRKFKPF